jgi:hypothetical protein
MSTENLIEMYDFWFSCRKFFVAARRYWKASFTEIYLIENVVFIQVYFLVRFIAAQFREGGGGLWML